MKITSIIAALTLDQLFKQLAEKNYLTSSVGPLKIGISLNPSAVFSLPASKYLLASISALIIIILLFWLFKKPPRSPIKRLGLAFLVGGGISNLLDRIFRGGVLDIFSLGSWQFNLADLFIALGLVFFLFSPLFFKNRLQNRVKNTKPLSPHDN